LVLLFVQFGFPELVERKYLPPETKVAFPWFALIGAGATFLIGWSASWLHPARGVST